jgi:hypothetical protein
MTTDNTTGQSGSILTLEDEFSIASMNALSDQMSRDQAIEFLKKAFALYVTTRRMLLAHMESTLPTLYEHNQRLPEEEGRTNPT